MCSLVERSVHKPATLTASIVEIFLEDLEMSLLESLLSSLEPETSSLEECLIFLWEVYSSLLCTNISFSGSLYASTRASSWVLRWIEAVCDLVGVSWMRIFLLELLEEVLLNILIKFIKLTATKSLIMRRC